MGKEHGILQLPGVSIWQKKAEEPAVAEQFHRFKFV